MWLLGTFAVLGFLEPFTALTFHAAVTALGFGSLVLGPCIGGPCALKLVLQRVRMSREEKRALDEEVVAFGVKHAIALGVWGLSVPLVPFAVGAFVGTLWNCAPAEGTECVAERCCSSR